MQPVAYPVALTSPGTMHGDPVAPCSTLIPDLQPVAIYPIVYVYRIENPAISPDWHIATVHVNCKGFGGVQKFCREDRQDGKSPRSRTLLIP